MRKIFLLAASVIFFAAGCKKDKPSPPVQSPFSYQVSGVKDLFIETTGTDSMRLNIERTIGTSQKVTLSVEGLPTNVTAILNPDYGLPPFTPVVKLVAKGAVEGQYAVTVKTNNPIAGEQKLQFNLTISKPVPQCIPSLVGNYTGEELCESTGVPPYPAIVEAIANKENKILIKNFGNFDPKIDIEVNVNCSAKKLTIVQQEINGTTVVGSGSFDDKRLYINYTVTNNSGITPFSVTCDAKYLRN
jgi:hypothetical protein